MTKDFTQMERLMIALKALEVPFEITKNHVENTDQVWYPSKAEAVCDVICHKYSYGGPQGLLEIMGLVDEEKTGDSVEGWLTAKEVASRILNDYLAA